jgi:hypothetical protein
VDPERAIAITGGVRHEFHGHESVIGSGQSEEHREQSYYADDRGQVGDEDTNDRARSRLDDDEVGTRSDGNLLTTQTGGRLALLVLVACCFGTAYGLALLLGLLTTGNRTRDAIIDTANAVLWTVLFTQYV